MALHEESFDCGFVAVLAFARLTGAAERIFRKDALEHKRDLVDVLLIAIDELGAVWRKTDCLLGQWRRPRLGNLN